MSGDLGGGPSPAPQPVGSPRAMGPASQPPPQQRGPAQQVGVRPAGPQQQKPPGAQVSGPLPPSKQGPPQGKGSTQPSPAKTAPAHPPSSRTEIRKQEQSVSRKQAVPKTEKEGDALRAAPKRGAQDVREPRKSSDMPKSKHHDVSDPPRPHCLCTRLP